MSDYSDKLKSPKWQKKRLEILNLRGFKCELCKNEEQELHVHHRFYIKGRKPWEYDNDVFQVLCSDCHEKEHSKNNKESIPSKLKPIIKTLDNFSIGELEELQYILVNINDTIDLPEFLHLILYSINSGCTNQAMQILRDKETIEELQIDLDFLKSKIQ